MEIGLIKDENDILKKELDHARRDWLQRSPERNDRSMVIMQNEFESRQNNGLSKTQSQNMLTSQRSFSHEKVKGIVQATQSNFEKMKRDIADKERVIQEKNQEILRLKVALEGNNNFHPAVDTDRRQAAFDLRNIVETLSSELRKVRGQIGHEKMPSFIKE